MKNKIAIIGLGYVGLPLAYEFSKKFKVFGFDNNLKRIIDLKKGFDKTKEVKLKKKNKIVFTSNYEDLKVCNIFIITVPTPVYKNNQPDLRNLKEACYLVSKVISKNSIVIFESTVYPGCTEEICKKIIEKKSKLKVNKDFYLGYSPERINPGASSKKIKDIIKITSGSNIYSGNIIDKLYKKIIPAGTYKAPNIKTAEAAKIIENIQRDINIAFVNELSLVFEKLNINTIEVIKAAQTKWNFNSFFPGLVGGHCIGVDPYYLAYKAKKIGIKTNILLAGRKINNSIPEHVVNKILNVSKQKKIFKKNMKILILGATFKEDCPDFRNSKVFDIMDLFIKKKISFDVYDPYYKEGEVNKKYQKFFISTLKNNIQKYEVATILVSHKKFKKEIKSILSKVLRKKSIIYDLKSILKKKENIIQL